MDEYEDRLSQLIKSICSLQETKEKVYGVDWKRFGLVSSMFNVFRKFIRLQTIWQAGWKATIDDSRLDTIVDLLNYLILCAILQAELAPIAFQSLLNNINLPNKLKPSQFTSNEFGFKLFCNNILLNDIEKDDDQSSLEIIIPKILAIGEISIEKWLLKLSDLVSSKGGSTFGGGNKKQLQAEHFVNGWLDRFSRITMINKYEIKSNDNFESNPFELTDNLYKMIKLCVKAAMKHGIQNPQEWNKFIEQNLVT